MHAIIMAAGEGSRMWPLSDLQNKCLLRLGGKPVIRHILDKILETRQFDRDDVTLVCHAKDYKDYKWEFRDYELNIHVVPQLAGTADEFYEALVRYAATEDYVLLHYGDTITDLDYRKMIDYWKSNATYWAMIAVTQNIRHDYSQVSFEKETSLVTSIEEKPKLSKPSWTGIGIFNREYFIKIYEGLKQGLLARDILDNSPPGLDFGYHILPAMVRKPGESGLYVYQYDGNWYDMGNLRSYQKLAREYQNKDLNL